MSASAAAGPLPSGPDPLHAAFLSLLPRVESHARIYFRHLKCPHRKADAIAETVAIAWRWFLRLVEMGKDAAQFVSTFAVLAARHVRSGRKLCGQEKSKDVMSPLAQQRYSFTVSPLPEGNSLEGNVFDEALRDNTRSAVPDQVAFRVDFPDWLASLSERDRRVVEQLILGERTRDVARRFGISPGRVSQLRREFHLAWLAFCDELPPKEGQAGAAGDAR
jgi:hypothetical protein